MNIGDANDQKPEGPGLRSTRRSLPIALLRARESVMGPIREMLSQSPLNEQKWRILRVLDENGEMEQTAIAEAACLLLPSLTRILRTLETEGYVARRTDSDDRRKSIVTLMPKGRQVLIDFAPQSIAISKRLEEKFGAERLEHLLDLLEELRDTRS